MKVKKFTASTIKEALAQIRNEMGENALIISTREMTGTLGRKYVEVMAAANDLISSPRSVREQSLTPQNLEEQVIKNRVLLSESVKPLKQELFQIRSLVDEMRRRQEESPGLEPLREEVRDLKRLFHALTRQVAIADALDFSAPLKDLYRDLLSTDVEESLAYKLIEMLDSRIETAEKNDSVKARARLRELIASLVETAKPVALNHGRPVVMAFIGPTGVGKTTTIAKLAARCSLQARRKVCLVTIDTYRIAAVEQLKTYARIMDLPIFVCYSAGEMREAIKENSDSALVLIDTAGRSQADDEQVNDLKGYFADAPDIEVVLVLSATTKNSDLRDITQRFAPVGADKLIFTKLDETTTFGPIINEAFYTQLPIAYFTTGQNVPDDIETATSAKLAGMLLGSDWAGS